MIFHLPSYDITKQTDRRSLFLLVRPFWVEGVFLNDAELKKKWGLEGINIEYISSAEDADAICLPLPLQVYSGHFKGSSFLEDLLSEAQKKGILVYGHVSGDFGEEVIDHPQLRIFRMGGFRSQLTIRHQGFPVALSDHLPRLFGSEDIAAREWKAKPTIGFCGHASHSPLKALSEYLKLIRENLRRALKKPVRRDYEPLFASALERARLLKRLESSIELNPHFIYRKQYRAGARTEEERHRSTLEYYTNIRESDYVLCVRGGGNFSVRFYETLLMGRIPIFVNTDCLLPFPDVIPWKEHVVWVEWEERHLIADKILAFHRALSPEQFKALQLKNRQLWKEQLNVAGLFKLILNQEQSVP
jgi:hypothetical protein